MRTFYIGLIAVAVMVIMFQLPFVQLLGFDIWRDITSHYSPPTFVQGQIADEDWLDGSAIGKIGASVDARFPPGSSVTAMQDELTKEGFEPYDRQWFYFWKARGCFRKLEITYLEDMPGRIEKAYGYYKPLCAV